MSKQNHNIPKDYKEAEAKGEQPLVGAVVGDGKAAKDASKPKAQPVVGSNGAVVSNMDGRKLSNKARIIIFAVLAVLVAASAGWLLLHKNKSSSDPSTGKVAAYDRQNFDTEAQQKTSNNKSSETLSASKQDATLPDAAPQSSTVSGSLVKSNEAALNKDYKTAIAELDAYVKQQNGNVQYTVYVNMGLYYKYLNDFNNAKIAYDKALIALNADTSLSVEDKSAAAQGIQLSKQGL